MRIINLIGYSLTFILLVLSLIHYHFVYGENHIALTEFLENPRAFAGREDSFMGPYSYPTFDGFVMIYNHHPIVVHYNENYIPPRFGEVLVYGTLNANGSVTAIGVHNYNYNYFIYFSSAIAGIMVMIYFFKEWKLTRRGFTHA